MTVEISTKELIISVFILWMFWTKSSFFSYVPKIAGKTAFLYISISLALGKNYSNVFNKINLRCISGMNLNYSGFIFIKNLVEKLKESYFSIFG